VQQEVINATLNESGLVEENTTENETETEPEPVRAVRNPRNASFGIGDGDFGFADLGIEPMRVYFISCGNADCVLVNKGSFYMLIDAGASEPVKELLNRLNVKTIHAVVATRDYAGAIGGLSDIVNSYDVEEFWYNGREDGSLQFQSLLSEVSEKGITIKKPKAGDRLNVSGLEITILNPQKSPLMGNPDVDAVVMKLAGKEFCVLLLNPTVQEREPALLSSGTDYKCEIMSYFKHGEGRPSASLMVEGVYKPKYVVISVGPNELGLPSPTTLTRLSIAGIKVYRTDSDGTVAAFSELTGGYSIGKYSMAANRIG
jgi:competence protein ComEC